MRRIFRCGYGDRSCFIHAFRTRCRRAPLVKSHGFGNVFQPEDSGFFEQLCLCRRELAPHVLRHHDATRRRLSLYPFGNIDATSINVVVILNDVADVAADTQLCAWKGLERGLNF